MYVKENSLFLSLDFQLTVPTVVKYGNGPQRMFINELMMYVLMYLLYKRNRKAKRVAYGQQTFEKRMYNNSYK